MKPAADRRFSWLAVVLLALGVASCREAPAPATIWATERSTETNGIRATLRLSTVTVTPGAAIACELTVQTPAASRVETPQLQPAGLELLDFTAPPPVLGDAGTEVRTFLWTFQAGPPGTVTNQSVLLDVVSGQTTHPVSLGLPAIEIRSAFAPGTFTNALPPPEENHAF